VDFILVRDLAARCVIGDNADERRARQDVVLQLRLGYEGLQAGRTDRLSDALDYRALKKRVVTHVEASSYRLLEALAESVADLCLADPRVRLATVTVDKPGALRYARSVAIEVTRKRLRPTRTRPVRKPSPRASPRPRRQLAEAR
jgi:D-erythro-7,8-dihydroneopterin triphosphate epimerase